ncbi:protein PTHB1-like [Clavelina lepadiformis]|uniref:protein PTHB1-like n=1 Tax=Clavelina lepadiformis TaxID=159417 RepID=UPI00404122C8
MSLFQVQEWWRCELSDVEECGSGSMCVANIDNSPDGIDKVIVGSYNGILHVYAPTKDVGKNPGQDVVLEINLSDPILQVLAGKFVSVSTDLHLAILHPRLLSVYQVTRSVDAGDQGCQYKMSKLYQHKLERSAANMIHGPFGGVKDQDFICVQSLDGALSIFEHESFTFTRFLPGFLLPGPLAYNVHTDSYITASSSYFLESYSYQVLAVASDADSKEDSQSVYTGKKIKADWTFNLGSYAFDVSVVNLQDRGPLIMVLCEHSLLCLESSGELVFMKKFEFAVSCFKCFPSPDGSKVHTILCTHSGQLQIYEQSKLLWAAKSGSLPVHLEIGRFLGTSGIIVMVDEGCRASCGYLGTMPTLFTLPRSMHRETDMARIDHELSSLNEKIQQQQQSNNGEIVSSKKDKEDLKIIFSVPSVLDKKSVAGQHVKINGDDLPSVTGQVILKVNRRITDIQVTTPVAPPLCSTIGSLHIQAVSEFEHSPSIRPSFFLNSYELPSTLEQELIVYYKPPSETPQVLSCFARLPLLLVAQPCEPIKKLEHKVTLESNKPCINLMELFPDFLCADSGPNCIGMQYFYGAKATILTSKSSNRYRIQCEEYVGLWLITDELVHRIHQKDGDVKISNEEQPSLEEYARLIDQHFRLRQMNEDLNMMMEQRARQYRTIQRRLLTRFKDKTPHSLNCLDTLLEGTHTQLLALADAVEEHKENMRRCSSHLSSASRLLVLLTRLWKDLSPEEEEDLASILHLAQTDNFSSSSGWEEIVDSSLTVLLKTTLSRSDGSMPTQPGSGILEIPQDTVKVKKHLAIFMDRLAKGSRLNVGIRRGDHPSKSSRTETNVSNPINRRKDSTTLNSQRVDAELDLYKEISDSSPPLPTDAGIRYPPQKMTQQLMNGDHDVDYETPLDERIRSMDVTDNVNSHFDDDITDILS